VRVIQTEYAVHELSIALGVVEAAEGEAVKRGAARVTAVHLRVGALAGVDADALRAAFELAREQSALLAAAALVIEAVPVVACCPTCAAEREVPFPGLLCPVCQTPSPEIVRGRELDVVAIEIET
jgi:hydrogenase nickel incorporation protein HypA/HybF